ncbi:CHAP domain-containing protein [Undibacterium pigrum]|uniref:CHAP domain-containing protein n=1 Tax=Undibacterium pigrum TaxID=401470 RepID=A0A318JB28_9BURK|nr:CHAP domain-containing protein [Undibacterium pigrum]PXX45308.1 CHAP domain-containing protein [Undibacterium pigrum]
MRYPGRIIKIGESDTKVVIALKKELNKMLVISRQPSLKLDTSQPEFDAATKQAVMLFQSQKVDSSGVPLKTDGQVGSLTWEALFGEESVVRNVNTTEFLSRVLAIAGDAADKKVVEQPRNSNKGPEVDEYLRTAGKPSGLAWCVAFIYYCFNTAATALQRSNPMVKTAGVLDHWNRCVKEKGARRITSAQAIADPSLIQPGMIFVMDHGGGLGHSGMIESVAGGIIFTIEGNTDASKTREGGGVYRLSRKIADINKGFIDYSGL